MGLQKSQHVLALVLAITLIWIIATLAFASHNSNKISGYTGLVFNKTGLCGNNEVDKDAYEQCDGIEDEACPGRCNNKICWCYPESEKRSKDLGPYEYFYFFDKIQSGDSGAISHKKDGISFAGLNFTVNNTQKDFRITVDTNASWPASLRKMDGGKTYQLFRIARYNLSNANITSSYILFRIPKTWLNENNFSASEVTLRRHSDIYQEYHYEWESIKPNQQGEDKNYYNYQTQTNGFSYFAVVAETPAVCGNSKCERGEDTYNCCTDCGVRMSDEVCKENKVMLLKCGDGICDTEHSESTETCCVDCGCPATQACEFNACQTLTLCGNNICEENENAANCLQDCGRNAFFSPVFLVVAASLVAVYALIAVGFKRREYKTKSMSEMPFVDKTNEDNLRERIKEQIGKVPAHELKTRLVAEGWPAQLVDNILRTQKVEFEPITPKAHNIYSHVAHELKDKPVHAVRSELLAMGWPAERVDEAIRKILLLGLARKYELHEGAKDSKKFSEFAAACKKLSCQPHEVEAVLAHLGWSKNIVGRAIKQIFGSE